MDEGEQEVAVFEGVVWGFLVEEADRAAVVGGDVFVGKAGVGPPGGFDGVVNRAVWSVSGYGLAEVVGDFCNAGVVAA